MKGLWWKALTGVWTAVAVVVSIVYAPTSYGFTMHGNGAKILFFHVPCAWFACVGYIMGAVYGYKALRQMASTGWPSGAENDRKSAVSMELGLIFAVLATVSGSIFSRNEWGMYWSWDPRQTSILVVLLLFCAYLVLRGSLAASDLRARLCGGYALIAVVPAIFIIWVLPRVVETLHGGANQAVVGGGLTPAIRGVLYGCALPAFVGIYTWLFQLGVRAHRLVAPRSEVTEVTRA